MRMLLLLLLLFQAAKTNVIIQSRGGNLLKGNEREASVHRKEQEPGEDGETWQESNGQMTGEPPSRETTLSHFVWAPDTTPVRLQEGII